MLFGGFGAVRAAAVALVAASAFALFLANDDAHNYAYHYCHASNDQNYFSRAQGGAKTFQHDLLLILLFCES